MKGRKKRVQLLTENRNALYNKTIRHNIDLSNKNTELSIRINSLENKCNSYEETISNTTWWNLFYLNIKNLFTLKLKRNENIN